VNIFVYLFFATVALPNITVLDRIYLVEIAGLLLLFAIPLLPNSATQGKKILSIDIIVLIYVFFNLIPVIIGYEKLYESARYYRAGVLTPGIVYFLIRFAPFSMKTSNRGFYVLTAVTTVQALFYIYAYLIEGGRPHDVQGAITSTISLSFLFGTGICFLIYEWKAIKSINLKLIILISIILLSVALIISATRMVIIGLLFLLPFGKILFKSVQIKKILTKTIMIGLCLFLGMIIVNMTIFPPADIQFDERRKIQKSSKRVISPELYIYDIRQRMSFWSAIAGKALEKPLMGHGAASYTIGFGLGSEFHLGSSHNILISALIVQGVPGVLLLLMMIGGVFYYLNRMPVTSDETVKLGSVLYILFLLMILVGITNDFAGGRKVMFFFFMGLCGHFYSTTLLDPQKNIVEGDKKVAH
jgi:hypothetical protein